MKSPAKDILQQFCDAIEVGPQGCLALMASDIVYHAPCVPTPIPKAMTGIAQVREVYELLFAKLFRQFSWSKLEVHGLEDPEMAMALASSRAELMNGRAYGNDYAFISRVRSGRIVEHWEFFDTERAAAAFKGLLDI